MVIFLGLFCMTCMVLSNYLFEYAHGRAWTTAFDRSYFQSASILAYVLLLLLSGTSCSAKRGPVNAAQAVDAPENCEYTAEYIPKAGNLRVDPLDERGWSTECLVEVMTSIKTTYGEMSNLITMYDNGRTRWMIISLKNPPQAEAAAK